MIYGIKYADGKVFEVFVIDVEDALQVAKDELAWALYQYDRDQPEFEGAHIVASEDGGQTWFEVDL